MTRWITAGLLLSLATACAAPGLVGGYGQPHGAYRGGELVVAWAAGSAPADREALLARYGLARRDASAPGAELLTVPKGQELDLAARLRREPAVRTAEPNFVVKTQHIPGSFRPYTYRRLQFTPNDPAWANAQGQAQSSPLSGQAALWGLRAINADKAWDVTAGSAKILVATIDTGADMSHPDLAANLDAADALNLVETKSPVDDDFGHGTHVAGIIAAVGNNATGVIGVAWHTTVLPIRVLGVDGTGSSYDTVTAIDYALSKGVKVINMSLGSPDRSDVEADEIAKAIAAGAVVVAASGNEATEGNYEEYPASYPGVIGVGAIGPDKKRALFSNYNSHVTVVAPGVDILSTIPSRMSPDRTQPALGYLSGTSMATPFVSGVAALVFARHPGWTSAQVAQQIVSTAQRLEPEGDDSTGANVYFGSGLVDAFQAVSQ